MYAYEWRGAIANVEVNALHAEGFGGPSADDDWLSRLQRYSLGWVCARDETDLIGFVNVAWDGGVHAFLLDTMVAQRVRRHGVGSSLVTLATDNARAAGCDWLHVDFEERLRSFYLDAGRFTSTPAGVIALRNGGKQAG